MAHLEKLAALVADPSAAPPGVRSVPMPLLDRLGNLDRQIAGCDKDCAPMTRGPGCTPAHDDPERWPDHCNRHPGASAGTRQVRQRA